MQRRLMRCLPAELAARSRITHERDGTIYVQADTPAVSAKLRNLTTRIFEDLRSDWPNLTGIHVGTQPTLPPHIRPREARLMDAEGKRQLALLGDSLAEGPLKQSLLRWSRR